ncbi:hypothetical protein CIB48_g3915 [Xylaria polymorpha]|nr:hypothetical protein CIB48_g3915 [Xylaria polymorpha]
MIACCPQRRRRRRRRGFKDQQHSTTRKREAKGDVPKTQRRRRREINVGLPGPGHRAQAVAAGATSSSGGGEGVVSLTSRGQPSVIHDDLDGSGGDVARATSDERRAMGDGRWVEAEVVAAARHSRGRLDYRPRNEWVNGPPDGRS